MAQEKKFVDGIFGKVFTFQNGGESYQLSAKAEEFIKFIKENTNSKGYINFDVNKQKNDPTKLSVSLNTFEPKAQNNSSNSNDDSGLPF